VNAPGRAGKPSAVPRTVLWPFQALRDVLMEGVYPQQSQIEHLAAIRESAAHDYLYDCLSVLDTKASALLQYDGIILAAATLAITLFSRATTGTVLVAVALILSGLSSVLCLQVIWVYWTETAEFSSDKDEFVTLLKRRNARTLCYRASWITAQASVFFLIVGVIATQL
jgi:hypothetical protein